MPASVLVALWLLHMDPQRSRSELKLLQVEARTREKLRPYMAWPTKPTEYHFCFAVWFGASCEASPDSNMERLHLPLWTAVEDGHTFLSLFHTRARVRTASNSNKAPWAGTSQLERLTYTTKIPDDLFDEGPLSSVSSFVRSGRLLVSYCTPVPFVTT